MPIPLISTSANYIKYNDLPRMIQNYIKNYDGLVLVREKVIDGRRTQGTFWYKSSPLGATVEDIPRAQKVKKETAIPSTISLSTNSKDALSKGDYNLVFRNFSGFSHLSDKQKNFFGQVATVFPNDPNPKFSKEPGVILFIGTSPDGLSTKSNDGNVNFTGVLLPSPKVTSTVIGTVVDSKTQQPIPYPTIKYFPTYVPPASNSLIPPNLIDMYKAKSITGEGDKNGKFSIEIPAVSEYLSSNGVNSSLLIPNSKLEVTITAQGYDITEKVPLKADGTFKSDLGIIELPSFEVIKKEAKLYENEITEEQMLVLQQNDIIKKEFIELQTETLLKSIKGKLTPFIINQLASFGIPDPIGLLKEAKGFEKKAERYERKQKKEDEKNERENENEGITNSSNSTEETT